MKFVNEIKRTHYCGFLSTEHIDKEVVVMGWVDTRRDHGGLVFVDLRDREGLVQIVLNPNEASTASSRDVRHEYVLAVRGRVRRRPSGMENSNLSTGEIEVEALQCEILSQSKTPPFQVDDPNVSENLRMKYRYLDLRSKRLFENLRLRNKIYTTVREFLNKNSFIEVETPILYKSTPEGARDYLVPSRVNQGKFYALPQSPQTLKQLLMISGFDRYFQICKCFRDEDLRANRQPEFSQIDIEMSFVERDDVMALNEALIKEVWRAIKGVDIGSIPRMSFADAMEKYGTDKPDLRFGLELVNLNETVRDCGFQVFVDTVARGAAVRGLNVPGAAQFSRSQLDKLTDLAKSFGAKGLVWMKNTAEGVQSPSAKFFKEGVLKALSDKMQSKPGDLMLIVADEYDLACQVMSAIRLKMGEELNLIDKTVDRFTWVVDFPLLEYSPTDKRWVARHHPFTMPKLEHLAWFANGDESKYSQILANAYDLVCNGEEIVGGSIRIHDFNVQRQLFKVLGLSEEETVAKFGFFIEALQYGTPPHGGAAWGLDRVAMILTGTDAIRDVIAFPKTARAMDLMADSPSDVQKDQLFELGIRLL